MITNDINLNNLRIFECVYRARSMTRAAQELHLTQSGVSQHVKALEDALAVKLFDRIKQRLVPTAAGTALYDGCRATLQGLESTLNSIRGGESELSGKVNFGMPIEFGNNLVVPALNEFAKQNPRVRFALRYGFATEMYEGILAGTLDFAFVDAFASDRRIQTERVYDEKLYLCASPELIKRKGQALDNLEYVDYQPDEPVLRSWFKHHYGNKIPRLNVRVTAMDVQGIARLVVQGLGAGVLPGHVVARIEKEGYKLHKFKGCGKPLKNSISVAYLAGRSQSPTVEAALKWLLSFMKTRL